MTNQPKWRIVGTLGDYNIAEYGGAAIYRDTTGASDPEMDWYEAGDTEAQRGEAYRFSLEKCTFVNGVLSDNEFHPEHPAWWADKIESIASLSDTDPAELIRLFCSPDPMERAYAYQDLIYHSGAFNLDQYPVRLTQAEANRRYAKALAYNRRHR